MKQANLVGKEKLPVKMDSNTTAHGWMGWDMAIVGVSLIDHWSIWTIIGIKTHPEGDIEVY